MNLTENGKKKLRIVSGIVTSVLLFVLGILFIASCYSIYKSGESPFTRESIAEAFSKIAVAVYITVFSVLFTAAVNVIYPTEEPKLTGKRSDKLVLERIRNGIDLSLVADDTRMDIEAEELLRRRLRIASIVLIALSATLPLIYLLNPANFPAVSGEYNAEVMRGMLVCVAALVPLLAFEIVRLILTSRSYKKEIELLRSVASSARGVKGEKEEKAGGVFSKIRTYMSENAKSITLGLRIAFVGCAVVFIIAGILNGGMGDVLQKAIKICTECIGLG